MLKEFKKFIMTGNVIDLAVAVLLAGAVGLVVNGFVNDIMMPIVGYFTGGVDFSDMKVVLSQAVLDADREGFLRNPTSLIQTIGRAARNVRGRVVLYGGSYTGQNQWLMLGTGHPAIAAASPAAAEVKTGCRPAAQMVDSAQTKCSRRNGPRKGDRLQPQTLEGIDALPGRQVSARGQQLDREPNPPD